jgi:adenylate cyclase
LAVGAVGALATTGIALLYLIALHGFKSNLWIPVVPPALAWLASAALVTVYLSGSERKARGAIMQMFSRSVSKDVAQSMWDQQEEFLDGGRPRPQPLVATVLFSDLKGFSSLSEKRTPEEVMDWLNELMGDLTQCVDSNRGVVNKYIGDAVMALFGVPVPRATPEEEAQDAKNAVRCALGMREALRRFNEKWKGQLPEIRMRVGVYTGPVVAGGLGNADRLEYTVIGNTVNIASRLESHKKELMDEDITAHGCRILIGKSTHNRLGGEFETREIENASLHNIAEEVAVFGVIGASGPRTVAEGMKACVAKT